ncbi:MAG: cation:proton antiporter subunit C [Pseudomonadota bacterium]
MEAFLDKAQPLVDYYNYFITIFLMVAGLFIVIARGNMIKKLIGLSLFQTSVYLLYLTPAKILGGTAPILEPAYKVYANPLPHVLILTAIVVGVATIALGLALVIRINEAYGSIEEEEIFARGDDQGEKGDRSRAPDRRDGGRPA